jgi:DNA adenine methylase
MDPESATRNAHRQPLLKWPGGKRRLVDSILPFIPTSFNRYFEPFLGGAALFFALRPTTAHLSDKNTELIQTYMDIRDRPDEVISALRRLKNSEKDYYNIRSSKPTTDPARAARMIYLITLSFNGIYRVNLRGNFNVPYGHKTHVVPCDEERLRSASTLLKNATLHDTDFEKAVSSATSGDLVYLDPPYTVAHSNNGFVKYNAKIFSWEDQIRLAKVAKRLVGSGCTVLVSNADHLSIRNLYADFEIATLERNSVIAASSSFRSKITECLFHSNGKH